MERHQIKQLAWSAYLHGGGHEDNYEDFLTWYLNYIKMSHSESKEIFTKYSDSEGYVLKSTSEIAELECEDPSERIDFESALIEAMNFHETEWNQDETAWRFTE